MQCLQTCLAHWPTVLALVVALAPSVVTGLTNYRTGGALGVASAVLDRLSVLTHRDAPGTLKPPVLRSTAPPLSPDLEDE